MIWRIEIRPQEGIVDTFGEGVHRDIADLGIRAVTGVEVVQVYNLQGNLTEEHIQKICRELLVNPVTQRYAFWNLCETSAALAHPASGLRRYEIAYNPGVTDPVEESVRKGIRDLGVEGIEAVRTARQYTLEGPVSPADGDLIVGKVLSNKLIQHVVQDPFVCQTLSLPTAEKGFHLLRVDLIGAGDKELTRLSREGQLFLNLPEMREIRKYFSCKLKRNPTDCELETIAQTWSEHCSHKTFRGNIRYRYAENGRPKTRLIRSLFKSTIVKATQTVRKPWCVSVFHDNAGVIRFDGQSNVCFKVETHNHPSALEPFGGANTGLGGVIRDILGTGLGAKPVCSTDIFCFAPPDMRFEELPPGTLHPKRILKGVVAGVRDYGNKMGIPTVNGAILFDRGFVGNPLVYCGNVGLIPRNRVQKKILKGDLIVLVGGRTGRDGIHGATFSSGELTQESEVVSSGAVQIGNPIQEKKVLDALMQARDRNLYTCVTDCGAGGLSSAVGEMGKELGARVDLDKVPLKYQGLNYDEIWISESQERMVLSVRPSKVKALLAVFSAENVEAVVIGRFTGNKRLELFYHGTEVCSLDMEFLHEGAPQITKEARWSPPRVKNPRIAPCADLTGKLLEVLSHYNVCSKEWVIRQYDHEVQGASVIKPLAGVNGGGPSDAGVIAPKLGSHRGIAVSNGINVRYGMIDPFWMAASCIDEAIRQIIAVGGRVERIALLDNFCWGNPDKPDRLGSLVRAALGCYKTAVGYGVPFISGKDSLYNEYTQNQKSIAIPGTLLISAVGIIDDVTKTVTMDAKRPGNLIYCVGRTYEELGGSIYWDTCGFLGGTVPKVNIAQGRRIFTALSKAVQKGLIRSMHDCSEGGLAAALAETAFAGGLGVTAHAVKVPFEGKNRRSDTVLFAESNSRFIVEVEPSCRAKFEKVIEGIPFAPIGAVEAAPELTVYGLDGKICVKSSLDDLKNAWQKPLKFS